jgi:hypothetical protein
MARSGFSLPETTTALILAAFGLCFIAACKTVEVDSCWPDQPINADGDRTEWKDIPFYHFKDEDVVLGISNDTGNLYVYFSFKNPQWARVIRMGGLTLWFDAKGKKKKDSGIRFRGGPPLEQLGLPGGGGLPDIFSRAGEERFLQMDRDTVRQFTVVDRKNNRQWDIPAEGALGPAVGFATSPTNGIHTYEFRIPLAKDDSVCYGIGTEAGKTMSIGAEWGGIERKNLPRPMIDMGGRPEGMGGFPGGKGGGRGGMPGGMRGMEKQEIWVKAHLATAPV